MSNISDSKNAMHRLYATWQNQGLTDLSRMELWEYIWEHAVEWTRQDERERLAKLAATRVAEIDLHKEDFQRIIGMVLTADEIRAGKID